MQLYFILVKKNSKTIEISYVQPAGWQYYETTA